MIFWTLQPKWTDTQSVKHHQHLTWINSRGNYPHLVQMTFVIIFYCRAIKKGEVKLPDTFINSNKNIRRDEWWRRYLKNMLKISRWEKEKEWQWVFFHFPQFYIVCVFLLSLLFRLGYARLIFYTPFYSNERVSCFYKVIF